MCGGQLTSFFTPNKTVSLIFIEKTGNTAEKKINVLYRLI